MKKNNATGALIPEVLDNAITYTWPTVYSVGATATTTGNTTGGWWGWWGPKTSVAWGEWTWISGEPGDDVPDCDLDPMQLERRHQNEPRTPGA